MAGSTITDAIGEKSANVKVKSSVYCCLLCSRDNCLKDKYNINFEISEDLDDDEITCLEENQGFSKVWREFRIPSGLKGEDGDGEGEVEDDEESCGLEQDFLNKTEQLVNAFILTKLLDIPPNKWDTNDGDDNQWLPICEDCLLTGVKKCWILDQEITRLSQKFHQVKQEIKEAMFERMEEMDKRRRRRARRKRKKISGGRRAPIQTKILNVIQSLNCPDSNDNERNENPKDKPVTTPTPIISEDTFENSLDHHDDNFDDHDNDPPENNYDQEDRGPDLIFSPPKKRIRKNLVCKRCNSRFHSTEDRDTHMSLHTLNDLEGSSALTCPICQFPCRTSLELDVHHHTRHVLPGRTLKTYHCPISTCSYQTKLWKCLKHHCDNQHPSASSSELGGDISLKCEQCNIQHENLLAYRYHMQITHQQEQHHCDDCGVIFSNKDKLLFHIFATHKRDSSYQCETCGKGFGKQYHLDKHRISHDKKNRRDFICHLCGMDYAYQFTLDNHYRTHHPNGDGGDLEGQEEFKCKYCDLKSPYKVVIVRHLQKHKEEMGWRCDKCGKCYMNRNGLRRHLEINHPQGEEKGRDWRCRWCNKGGYQSRNAVDTHERKFCRVRILKEQCKEELDN